MNIRLTKTKFLCVFLMAAMLMSMAAWSQDKGGDSHETDRVADLQLSMATENALEERLAQMSPEALSAYLLRREEMRLAEDMNPFNSSDTLPILAILTVFGMPVMIIALIAFFKYKRRKLLHETVRAMVEKGVDIPAHLFEEEAGRAQSAFRKGVVLIGLGIGLCGFFLLEGEGGGIGIGLIPLFIGAAYLVIWRLEGGGKRA